MKSINCRGSLIDFRIPKVMGILNLTPDSFYDGGKYKNEDQILKQVEKMLKAGAAFIDLGAYSSRPGAIHIAVEEEEKRLIPVVKLLCKNFPEAILSIDTFRAKVADAALAEGACIINDISAGLLDTQMLSCIAKWQVPYIMMHMKGTPQTMRNLATYEDLLKEILFYFSQQIQAARALGINDIIVDPGFGFAKNIPQNFELLNKLEFFKILNAPILAGLSRKSMVYKTLGILSEDALNGTTSLNTIALLKGASILRVHDVAPAIEAIKLVQGVIAE